jgi:hypothetical protein
MRKSVDSNRGYVFLDNQTHTNNSSLTSTTSTSSQASSSSLCSSYLLLVVAQIGVILPSGIAAQRRHMSRKSNILYPALEWNSWMLGLQEPLQCGCYGKLVAGSGQPNYD